MNDDDDELRRWWHYLLADAAPDVIARPGPAEPPLTLRDLVAVTDYLLRYRLDNSQRSSLAIAARGRLDQVLEHLGLTVDESGWNALRELWPTGTEPPTTLAGIASAAGSRVVVRVRCARDNTVAALVLRSPSGILVTITERGDPGAPAHIRDWVVSATLSASRTGADTGPIRCPRCNGESNVDLVALSTTATRPRTVRA